jgi:hypothetical protein
MSFVINKENFIRCFQDSSFQLRNLKEKSDIKPILERCKSLFGFYQENKAFFPSIGYSLSLLREKLKAKISESEADILGRFNLESLPAGPFPLPAASFTTTTTTNASSFQRPSTPPPPPLAIALVPRSDTSGDALMARVLQEEGIPPEEKKQEKYLDLTANDEALARALDEPDHFGELDYKEQQRQELCRLKQRHLSMQAKKKENQDGHGISMNFVLPRPVETTPVNVCKKKHFLGVITVGALTALVVLMIVLSLSKGKK